VNGVETLYLILFVIALVLAGLFCSMETAFIGLQKLRIKHLARTGDPRAARVVRIIEHPEKFLATVLLGINFFETAVATLGTIITVKLVGNEGIAAAVATAAITIITLVIAEVIPKNLGARYGEAMALRLTGFVEVSALVLFPIVWVLSRIGLGFQKIGVDGEHVKRPTLSAAEMQTAVNIGEAEGVLDETEAEMITEVLRFSQRIVREIMTPRTEVTWVQKGLTYGEFLRTYQDHPHTRFPVFEGTPDNVVGILSIKDVLVAQASGECAPDQKIAKLVRPAYFVPTSKRLGELLAEMRERNHHLTIVISEFGGVAGIVTLEQMIEEIVGDIGDELLHKEQDVVTIDERTFKVDAAMRVEDANEELQLGLPIGPYSTIAGFILSHLGRIPKQGEQFKYKNLRVAVVGMEGNKIEEVLLAREKDAAAAG
jgi:putative hemolysin